MVPRRQMSPPFDASSDSFRMGADRRLGAWRGEDRRVGAALSIERRARSRSYSDVYRRAKRSLHIVRSASDWGLTALSILNWVVMTLNFVLRTRASEIVILGGSASIGANVVDSGTSTSSMAVGLRQSRFRPPPPPQGAVRYSRGLSSGRLYGGCRARRVRSHVSGSVIATSISSTFHIRPAATG